jgi:hypothetical protein
MAAIQGAKRRSPGNITNTGSTNNLIIHKKPFYFAKVKRSTYYDNTSQAYREAN